MSLVHLYAAYAIIPAFILRGARRLHSGPVIFRSAAKRLRHRLHWYDVAFAVLVGIIAT